MGSDAKLLVLAPSETKVAVIDRLRREGMSPQFRGEWIWVRLEEFDEKWAQRLSSQGSTVAVVWTIHTGVGLIWLRCFSKGKCVRELMYSSEEGWAINRGRRMPFENAQALRAWMETRNVLATPDGYDVLEAFLGTGEPHVSADAASKNWMLPPPPIAFRAWSMLTRLFKRPSTSSPSRRPKDSGRSVGGRVTPISPR